MPRRICSSSGRRGARDALIREHVPFARRLARRVASRVPRSVGSDELESAALLGLTEAATRYDPRRGETFPAYAAKRVRGAIFDELRHMDVLTRRGREGARRLDRATRSVEAAKGRPATAAEIALEMGIAEEQVVKDQARWVCSAVIPLDSLREPPSEDPASDPAEAYQTRERKRALVRALAQLEYRDLLVLAMYYQEGLNLREIGTLLDVTESRVCQIRGRAVRTLRRLIGS